MMTELQMEQAWEARVEREYSYCSTEELWDKYQTAQGESDAYQREWEAARDNYNKLAMAEAADKWNAATDYANELNYALSLR